MSTVAAVLVTRNSSRWIEATLRSVLGQSRQPDEIIVIDDGSTDETCDTVSRLIGERGRLIPSVSTATDRSTRILR